MYTTRRPRHFGKLDFPVTSQTVVYRLICFIRSMICARWCRSRLHRLVGSHPSPGLSPSSIKQPFSGSSYQPWVRPLTVLPSRRWDVRGLEDRISGGQSLFSPSARSLRRSHRAGRLPRYPRTLDNTGTSSRFRLRLEVNFSPRGFRFISFHLPILFSTNVCLLFYPQQPRFLSRTDCWTERKRESPLVAIPTNSTALLRR
ncbi:hypothetical protein CH063_10945 [Colletotrichum higginsianum]|uniref:Uncharacterized protein n=1 Tax=Colletotrichum higginsianum (strain IMI 349063) TaxID=759273 RepID=H1VJF7_COLHI|nr:hypothetical protein CH063_10945 [Colletotrichum higginsianum]